jgi:hypothetical protein
VNFIHWVHRHREGPLCFVSRDGYLLQQLYTKIYPGFPSYYVYSSRKALRTGSPAYVRYISQFRGMSWVDVHGSNKSHVDFFRKHFPRDPIPHKFVMLAHPLTIDYSDNLREYSDYATKPLCWGKGHFIEYLLRAPHASVIDVNDDGGPIFENNGSAEDFNDDYVVRLMGDYVRTVALMRPGMSLFNEYDFVRSAPAVKPSTGVLALDIDGTTECRNMAPVRELVRRAKALGYAIVIITARSSPLGIDLDAMGLHGGADIYFNFEQRNISQIKAQQLEHAHRRAGLTDPHQSVLVDDIRQNIEAVVQSGFRGVLAPCGSLCDELMQTILVPV